MVGIGGRSLVVIVLRNDIPLIPLCPVEEEAQLYAVGPMGLHTRSNRAGWPAVQFGRTLQLSYSFDIQKDSNNEMWEFRRFGAADSAPSYD